MSNESKVHLKSVALSQKNLDRDHSNNSGGRTMGTSLRIILNSLTKAASQRLNARNLTTLLGTLATAAVLSACGASSSGQSNEIFQEGADGTSGGGSGGTSIAGNYSGAAPSTDDVQNFKLELWDNLINNGRCVDCHGVGGTEPQFVRDDNINLAYAAANTAVNLSDPGASLLVTQVANGHNCWETSNDACAATMTRYIERWAGGSTGSQNEIVLRAPELKDPGATKTFPDSSATFAPIHGMLTAYCSDCHVEGDINPYLGSSDIDTSYDVAQPRIDLDTPSASRLVQRLRSDFHNCWEVTPGAGVDCIASADAMQSAIQTFSDGIVAVEIDPDVVASKALNLINDGITANTGGRFEDNVIALYEFQTGEGITAFDTSGVEPAMNLTLSGNTEWVGGWGIRFGSMYTNEDGLTIQNGKAQASTTTSRKLYDQLTATNEYTLEAWVVPNNVTQEDARIMTYSGSATSRNLALGQTLYNYDAIHRSTTSDQNEAFSTADADERLQATLQHVVVTYTPVQGRRIYVNGTFTDDLDPDEGGLFSAWDSSFAFVLGNETDGNSLWQGSLRFVAIHDRALSDEQITQNYDVGVGEKFYLLFGVSDLIDVEDAFVVFEAAQFDSYSYLFTTPFFTSLSDDPVNLDSIPVEGIRIGINGKEASVGQAYANLNTTLENDDYVDGRQVLSPTGTIIPLEQGPDIDEFFLSFERIGDETNVIVDAGGVSLEEVQITGETSSDIGLKTFDEINASMAKATQVSSVQNDVASTYQTIRQQLPSSDSIDGFLSAHQMAVTQLAIQYCDALVEDNGLRATYFPGFDFSAAFGTAFDNATKRSQIISPLLQNMVGSGLTTQPGDTAIEDELNDLLDLLTACTTDCGSNRTETIVKATCAAVLGSAVTIVQ